MSAHRQAPAGQEKQGRTEDASGGASSLLIEVRFGRTNVQGLRYTVESGRTPTPAGHSERSRAAALLSCRAEREARRRGIAILRAEGPGPSAELNSRRRFR